MALENILNYDGRTAIGPELARVHFPQTPPKAVLVTAFLAMVIGFFVTADLLVALGPMRQSLTSPIASVRSTAHAEIFMFRLACLAFASLPFFWEWIAASSFVHRIAAHEPRDQTAAYMRNRVVNTSLFATACCTAIGMLYVGLGDSLFSAGQQAAIHEEDGLIEYGTAFLFFVCSVVSALLAFRHRHEWKRAAMFLVFALGFLFISGEEISWGQRIFGVETLEIMKKRNVQAENNVHNLFGYLADHLFILGVFVYGVVFPLLTYKLPFFRKFFDYIGLPTASLGLAVGFVMISCLHDWTVGRVMTPLPGLRAAELRELLSAFGFLVLLNESWRWSRMDREQAPSRLAA